MMKKTVDDFNEYREKMNEKLLAAPNNKILQRIYSIDAIAYKDGALNARTKEMLGLATSMVLRCDDCIRYHLIQCHQLGVSTEELVEVFGIANLVGGTIVIPHTRRAFEFWEELHYQNNS
jgi:AhpD family alkylhydroperoxidase